MTELEQLNQLLDSLDPGLDLVRYYQAFERLRHAYHLLYVPDRMTNDKDLWPVILSWLYTLSDSFIRSLHSQEPVSLIILSFFILLLQELDST
ncbi:hypothetical protein BJX62DRAFT_221378 [Aspergillus germanicus]